MSFTTDLQALKNAINAYGTLIKDKIATLIPTAEIGNTVAPLVGGLIPAQYLPSFVDDVLEFNGIGNFPLVGESGKLYIDTSSAGMSVDATLIAGAIDYNFPVADPLVNLSISAIGRVIYSSTSSNVYKFALKFNISADTQVRVSLVNMVSQGPNWDYAGPADLNAIRANSGSGLTYVSNGEQYTFTLNATQPYLLFRGDYPSDSLIALDAVVEAFVGGVWVPISTGAAGGSGSSKAYRWTGASYFQINNSVGSADVASRLTTARNISASGDASWTVLFDGTADVSAVITLNTVPVAKGGTGATTPVAARAALGLVIGTDVQTQNADLQSIANIPGGAGLLKKTAAGAWTLDLNSYSLSTHNHDAAYTPLSHVGTNGGAHGIVTTTVNGFMSAADKSKLDGVASGATANLGTVTAVTASAPMNSSGGTTPNITMGAANAANDGYLRAGDFALFAAKGSGNGTVTNVSGIGAVSVSNQTSAPVISISAASTAADGTMSAADKLKLDGITGTNTGDETAATIKSKLGITVLSGTNTGDQTSVTGNAGTATKLQNTRLINGVAFDGTTDITINAVDATARIAASEKGATNGVAPLVSGVIPSQYLPSFVDDVLEYSGVAAFPAVGEAAKIYVDISNVDLPAYRWTGTVYIQVNNHVGMADAASKLATARSIAMSGDGSWSVTFDGSGNATAVMTLATVPVAKGGTGAVTAPNARANLGLAIGTDVQAQNADLQAIVNIVATSGLLKKTAAGTWSLDTNTYSISTHNHDSVYAPIAHVGAGGTAHAAVTTTVNGFMLAADKVKVDALSGTNSGDETTATIKTKLGISTLSGSNTGDQSISISGDVTASGSFGVLVATVTKINGVALSGLATGLLKNTTASGAPSIAVAGTDYVAPGGALGTPSSGNLVNCTFPTLNQNTTGNAATATTATNAAQLTGVQQTNPLFGSQSSMSMSADAGATRGSFIARATGAGDANLAGMTFWNDAYAVKLGVRADGYFGLGGWSRTAWSWYSDPSGNMVAAGNVSAYSDPRLKSDIRPIINALDICDQLNGVYFTWNYHSKLVGNPGKEDIGLLADQVKAVLPMLVTPSIKDEDTGETYDTVDYTKMVPILLEAIKSLREEVRLLKA